MKKIIFLFLFFINSNFSFGQLVSGVYHDFTISTSTNSIDYEETNLLYKKYMDEKEFVLISGYQERLQPRKDALYFVESKSNNKEIAIYFFMPFNQAENDEKLEMMIIRAVKLDLSGLDNGTYFIDYRKDLLSIQNAYNKKEDAQLLLTIDIPSATISSTKVSDEFISKEKVTSIEILKD